MIIPAPGGDWEALPRPQAIVVVSAHWYTRGTGVTAMERPQTLHDFGGFPQALYDMHYPAWIACAGAASG